MLSTPLSISTEKHLRAIPSASKPNLPFIETYRTTAFSRIKQDLIDSLYNNNNINKEGILTYVILNGDLVKMNEKLVPVI